MPLVCEPAFSSGSKIQLRKYSLKWRAERDEIPRLSKNWAEKVLPSERATYWQLLLDLP